MRRLLLLGLLALPALAGPWRSGEGPHTPESLAKLVLTMPDESELELRLTWPKEEGKYPVLVFSHGMYGSKDGYAPLVRHWVEHGYVVLQPTHPDSLRYGFQADAAKAWEARARQVSFLLDALPEIEKKVGGLAGKLDRGKIGVGGHSFGAHTSQLIGGVKAYAGGGESYADARASAVLLLSPQGRGGLFREDSWKTLAKPALVLTGSNDVSPRTGEKPEWRLDAYRLAPAGERYLVWIEGAHHGFGGISGVGWRGAGPKNDDHVWAVQQATLAFWDAFVKGDAKARAWLDKGELARTDRAEIRCENKLPSRSEEPPDRR